MDQSVHFVEQPQSPTMPTETKKSQTKTIAGIVTAIVVLLFTGVALIKGFPTLQPKISKIPPRPTPTPIALPCPSVPEFCSSIKEITQNNTYQGLGEKVATGSPLYAVFDGRVVTRSVIMGTKQGDKTFTQASIENDKRGMIAVYLYTGKTPAKDTIKTGEIIASASADIPGFSDTNFIFILNDKTGMLAQKKIAFK